MTTADGASQSQSHSSLRSQSSAAALSRVVSGLDELKNTDPDAASKLHRLLVSWSGPTAPPSPAFPPPPPEEHWRVHQWYTPLLFWRGAEGPGGAPGSTAPDGVKRRASLAKSLDADKDGKVTAWDFFAWAAVVVFVGLLVVAGVAIGFTTREFLWAQKNRPRLVKQVDATPEQFVLPVLTICPRLGDIPSWMFNFSFKSGTHALIDRDRDVEEFWHPSEAECGSVDSDSVVAGFNPEQDASRLRDPAFVSRIFAPEGECRYCRRLGGISDIQADMNSSISPLKFPQIRISMDSVYRDIGLRLDWFVIFIQAKEQLTASEPVLNYSYWRSYGYGYERQVMRLTRVQSEFDGVSFENDIVNVLLNPKLPPGGDPDGSAGDFVLKYGFNAKTEIHIKSAPAYSPWEFINDVMGFIGLVSGLTLFHMVIYPLFYYLHWRRDQREKRSTTS